MPCRVTSFQLICTPHSDKSYIFIQSQLQAQDSTNETVLKQLFSHRLQLLKLRLNFQNLLLFSPYACPVTIEEISHSGIGKVLLILLFVGSFTYFAIGSIVRFMYLGARGIEVIPNLAFGRTCPGWCEMGLDFCRTVAVSSERRPTRIRTMRSNRKKITESPVSKSKPSSTFR